MLNKIHLTKVKERMSVIREGEYDPDTIFVYLYVWVYQNKTHWLVQLI